MVRVSTSTQDYEAQIYDLKEYAKRLDYESFHIIETKETAFADYDQKIGTNEMFKYIQNNPQYNTIFITELSRLARRQSILHSIKEWLVSNKIQLYIKDSEYKLLDNSGQITQQAETMFTLYGLFAEAEIRQKLERFQRKKKELMESGFSIGGKLLFGYDRLMTASKKNTLIINEEQAKIIRTIYNWYLQGLDNVRNPSIKRIAIECIKQGLHPYTHSKRNVNKLLKEQAYLGEKITNNKRKNPKHKLTNSEPEYLISNNKIKYPIIIEFGIFNAVQVKLKSNIVNSDKDTKHTTILSKLINCPSCGRKLSANYRIKDGLNKNSYRCTGRTDAIPCSSTKSLSMNLIDSAVWSLIKADLPLLSKKINEINPNIYLAELETQFQNFIVKENEIENDININLQLLKSVNKIKKSTEAISLINETTIKIQKLQSELEIIESEKSRIESNKLLINKKQENIEDVIMDNLINIEQSKELLKKYINSFVEEIIIFEHNTKYSILGVVLKEFTVLKEYPLSKDNLQYNLAVNFIIIDKRVTRQIKLFYHQSLRQERKMELYKQGVNTYLIPIFKRDLTASNQTVVKAIEYTKLTI